MPEKIAVTPEVLRWARDGTGMSAKDAAEALKSKAVSAQTIERWESGDDGPTYSQLEQLAQAYHRPVAAFFLPKPPSEPGVKEQFRALTPAHLAKLPPGIRFLVRLGTVRQMDLREIYNDAFPAAKNIIADCAIDRRDSPKQRAARVREYIGVSLRTQFGWQRNEDALNGWRHALEECGVWVFKDAFKDDGYCGFCLPDGRFPVIYVNNSMPQNRQIFTLFHELAHLLRGRGGVDFRSPPSSADDDDYRREEEFCNAFAGALLVPDESLFSGGRRLSAGDASIEELAHQYRVSREVILRRFLDRGLVNQKVYEEKTARWKKQHPVGKGKGGGGDYYATQFAYLGRKYAEAAFGKYHRREISEYELADYLGVKVRNVGRLEDKVRGRAR